MKTYKEFILEISSAINIPPEAREAFKQHLMNGNPKEILNLFRQYNPKKDEVKWKTGDYKLGGHKKSYYKPKPIPKDPYADENV